MAGADDEEGKNEESIMQHELWSILCGVEKELPGSSFLPPDEDRPPPVVPGEHTRLLQNYCDKHEHLITSLQSEDEKEDSLACTDLYLNSYGPTGFKPLHYLCDMGGPEFSAMADLLLHYGNESGEEGGVERMLNVRGTASGDPPLLLAVCGGHVAAVQWLLARGANVHLTDRFGKSPLAVARKKARAPYPFDNFKAILRLLENHLDFSGDVQRAEALRLEGNALFGEKQPKRAAVKYSESLELAADARTWANRSQCYLSIARQSRESEVEFRCRGRGREFYLDLYQRALADAEAAIAMEPREPKAYYRAALALMGLGRVHRALDKLCSGVQSCGSAVPVSSNVQKMESMMTDLLQKLQLEVGDRRRLYGEPADQQVRNVFTGISDPTRIQTGAGTFSPSEIPGNMCMWCETLLPPSMLSVEESLDFKSHNVPKSHSSGTGDGLHEGDVENEKPSDSRLCLMCSCPVDDQLSPQLLRDKYLGGSTCSVNSAGVTHEGVESS